MPQLTSQQANELANNFLELAQAIGDFRYDHWDTLSVFDNQRLGNWQWAILNYGEDILVLSTTLVMDDVQDSLSQITQVTTEIKSSIKTLQNIQKGIDVAAAMVTLGAAIISKSPQSIVAGVTGVRDAWKAS